MIRIPNPQSITPFSIPNNSDKGGNIWYTKNINFDEEGYIKLSPRNIQLFDEATSTDNDFDVPVALARYNNGVYIVPTTDRTYEATIGSTSAITFTENSDGNAPQGTTNSHGAMWQSRIHTTENTVLLSRSISDGSNGAWTDRVTGLTGSVRHHMCLFRSLLTLCVTNGNVVQQYDTAYSSSGISQLTLPADYETVGLAYNNGQMGVITCLGTTSQRQNQEAYFFLWDGVDTSANGAWGVGSDGCIAICAYRSSFLILTKAGQLKYFNGGGFDDVAAFPFYFNDNIYGDLVNQRGRGNIMIADGDVVYINLSMELNAFGSNEERQIINCPSGVWTFDPKVGLYHRSSPSLSQAYAFVVTDTNTDITTNIMTVSSGTVPATGSIVRYTAASTVIGGLELNADYYVIKLSSSTFSLAETKALAEAGTAIDLTSKGSGGNNNFWMYDIKDYSQTYTNEAGAITLVGETNMLNKDFVIGSDIRTTALALNANICVGVPGLEARGYFVTPKIFSSQVTDTEQKLYIKYRPLKDGDSIVVKSRTRHVAGLPVTTPQVVDSDEATWGSARAFTTASNLSDALTAFNAGIELELELVAGVGAGTCIKITNLYQVGSSYTVVVGSDVIGAADTLKSHFIIDHWIERQTIDDSTTMNADGFAEIPISGVGSWIQFKVELRGVNVSIEEIQIINEPAKKSV